MVLGDLRVRGARLFLMLLMESNGLISKVKAAPQCSPHSMDYKSLGFGGKASESIIIVLPENGGKIP
jgi:hypothetical protein